MTSLGPLLTRTLDGMRAEAQWVDEVADIGKQDDIAVTVRLPQCPVRKGTSWAEYREGTVEKLERVSRSLDSKVDTMFLIAGRSLQTRLDPAAIERISRQDLGIVEIELDPLISLALLNHVSPEIGLASFRALHPELDGSGVKVAVIDSGIDSAHPALKVSEAVSACDEPVDAHGDHGTHCAGIIASNDSVYRGIAPGVTLFDVKVLRANGFGKPGDIARGIDAALDLGADILSMSVGSNHFPTDFFGGNGWSCPDGRCPLCMAVDNAFLHEGAIAFVAAGNDHDRADSMREQDRGHELDTELSCPGQSRHAVTVGAITKNPWNVAHFSSYGPTAYGATKPDLSAPGVGVTSSITVPRNADGVPILPNARKKLFASHDGTSVATPIAAGLAALALQELSAAGSKPTPAQIRKRLLANAITLGSGQANETGRGRVQAGL